MFSFAAFAVKQIMLKKATIQKNRLSPVFVVADGIIHTDTDVSKSGHELEYILKICMQFLHKAVVGSRLSRLIRLIEGRFISVSVKPILLHTSSTKRCQFCSKSDSSATMDLSGMRKSYKEGNETFDVSDLTFHEPIAQFRHWFEEACHTDGIDEANSMTLATADKNGRPSARILLLKGFDDNGFKFFTNYSSRKGQELDENPYCTMLFYWPPLKRYVRIEGKASKLSVEEGVDYFHSRPRNSQIGAIVSKQSSVIESREVMDSKVRELQKTYEDESIVIPKPDDWGGYCVTPEKVEFWQGQTSRVHDRILFRRPEKGEIINKTFTHEADDGWVYERLAP